RNLSDRLPDNPILRLPDSLDERCSRDWLVGEADDFSAVHDLDDAEDAMCIDRGGGLRVLDACDVSARFLVGRHRAPVSLDSGWAGVVGGERERFVVVVAIEQAL